jgi:hypothetical protein
MLLFPDGIQTWYLTNTWGSTPLPFFVSQHLLRPSCWYCRKTRRPWIRASWYNYENNQQDALYEVCPESIQPFRIPREPVAWPWCNLAAGQRRPYCASVNSHCAVGQVSRQWDAVDSACVPCDRRIHQSPHFQRRFYVWENPEVAGNQIWAVGVLTDLDNAMFCYKSLHESCRMGRRIDTDSLICSLGHCECDSHTAHKLSQRRLTADWLAPRDSYCSRKHSKVSSDQLPSYIKATLPVLEIFKMAGYFPDRPRMATIWNY